MKSSPTTAKKSASPIPDQAVTDLMKPGPEHAELAKTIGTWKVAYTQWMKEGAEPTKATGKSMFTKLFDGRFIREEFSGDFHGEPFTGIGTMGFDRAANRFVNTWYDSMGTGITSTAGTISVNGKDLVMRGTMTCPIKGEMHVRHVYGHESNDKFTLTMFCEHDGKENKSMELVYTRQS